jgi:hypothetical protein
MYRYKQLVDIDTMRAFALKGYGESAMKANALERAEWAYQTIINRKLTDADGNQVLSLADIKYRLGKYAEAKLLYQNFLANTKAHGLTSRAIESIQNNMDNCDWALGLKPNAFLKTPLVLLDTGQVNTVFSEYAPYPLGDTLYFSSYRFPFKGDAHFVSRKLIKILAATNRPDGSLTAEPANFNEEKLHVGQVTFNEKADVMYYTIGRFVNSTEIRFELYRRKMLPDHTWGGAEKLPDYINLEGYTATEPSVGHGPADHQEVLYFVSDRPGGKGKRDIWYSFITPDSLTHPVNLSALNTPGDDVTPFYQNSTGTLYFSTDSLQTMGGLDVYRSNGTAGKEWSTPDHLHPPINSGYNDAYFALNREGTTIFMASNRRGDQNASEEACCYDLFKADLVAPKMLAIAFNKMTGDSLRGTTMRLIELGPDGKVISDKPFTLTGPSQAFEVLPGKKYMIIGSKDRFSNDTVRFETPKLVWKDQLIKKLYLNPAKVDLVVTVLEKDTKLPIKGATALFYDLGAVKPVPTKPYAPKSDTHEGDNQFLYPLEFDHRYKVVISKPGYTSDSTGIVSTENLKQTTTIRDTVRLTRGVNFKAHTVDIRNNKPIYGVTYRLFDLPDEKLRDQYISPLNKDYQTTVAYEHRYMLIGSKEDYTSDTVIFTTLKLPKKDFQTIERELRIRPLNPDEYLPIVLYFDNDEPDKRTMKRSTEKEYRVTYVDYIREKDKFIEEYTKGLTGDELTQSTVELDSFFEKEVRGGWNNLMTFSEALYDMMTHGDTIEITLKGYASPRAGATYNLNLTDRRVSSVYKHFDLFDGGIYKKFVLSHQLIIKRESNGSTKAPKDISKDINDRRNSIYDVRASRERRLEIIGVRVNKDKKL